MAALSPALVSANSSCRSPADLVALASVTYRASLEQPPARSLNGDLAKIERGLGREVIRDINARGFAGTPARDALATAVLAAAYSAEGVDDDARNMAERALGEARSQPGGNEAQVSAIVSTVYLRLGLRDEGLTLLRRAATLFGAAADNDAAALASLNLARASRSPEERVQASSAALTLLLKSKDSARNRYAAQEAVRIALETYPADRYRTGTIYRHTGRPRTCRQ
jgi:tetratricopeptide (TPR) repeat protein